MGSGLQSLGLLGIDVKKSLPAILQRRKRSLETSVEPINVRENVYAKRARTTCKTGENSKPTLLWAVIVSDIYFTWILIRILTT